MPGPLVIAHRGASAERPENSLAAFRRAVELKADGIELDVHATADGELVVNHDDTLDGRPISETMLAAARAHHLPNGEPVPTLAEALAAAGGAITVFVEVKALAPGSDARLFKLLDGGPAPSRYQVHSFDHRIIRRLHDQRPAMRYGALSTSYLVNPVAQLHDAGATVLWQEASEVDAALVDAVHAADCTIIAWTVDNPRKARALAALGVDGLCTNKPDVIRQALS
jgi:glycerophosphoryl diester phosphodiesterase